MNATSSASGTAEWAGSASAAMPALGWGLAALALVGSWRVLRRVLPALMARYDKRVQRPPEPVNGRPEPVLAGRLHGWCFDGAGSGAAPLWRPGQRPQVPVRLALAVLGGDAAVASGTAQLFALQLDGSHQLQAAGTRWAGLRLRLRVKWADACWWRPRQPSDPWDAGYLLNLPATPAALLTWSPRRASLLIADGLQPDLVLACLRALAARQAGFDHPVRLLVLVGAHAAPALRAAARGCGLPVAELGSGAD